MIPALLILAVAYWLAAPDPVTAGARTAAGTGVRAAGSGVRSHWAKGRKDRELSRTARRDRWWKAGGLRRFLLRGEHGAVITGKAAKGAVKVTAAAARPVPAAVKRGWVQGRDRHQRRAGNRPAGLVLDPPWWHRGQPQVQPADPQVQDAGTGREQVQVQPGEQLGNRTGEQVPTAGDSTFLHVSRAKLKPGDHLIPGSLLPDDATSQGHAWYTSQGPDVAWRAGRVWLWPTVDQARNWMDVDDKAIYEVRAVDPKPLDCCDHTAPDPECETGGDCGHGQQWHAADAVVTRVVQKRKPLDALASLSPFGRRPAGWTGEEQVGAHPSGLPPEQRCEWCDDRARETERGKLAVCTQCAAEIDEQITTAQADHPPAGTSHAGTPSTTAIPTEGDPVPSYTTTANVPSVELNDLDSLKRFAEYISSLGEDSEFMQIVERCKSLRESLREGGFGGHVDQAGASFEETAAALGQLGTEFCEEAGQMAQLAANVAGG